MVGLGIAGMSAAIGLRRAGWTPVIVERAPERRTGGYFVGLFPEGRQAAVDLGIADHLHTRNPEGGADAKAWSVDRRGRRRPALGFLDQPGGPAAVLRGDIEAALWQSITGVEVWFGTAPVAITEGPAEVQVLFENAGTGARYSESFDLVVGADGMRSSVRRTVFGPDEDYLANWKAMICAFQLKEQVPTYEASDSARSSPGWTTTPWFATSWTPWKRPLTTCSTRCTRCGCRGGARGGSCWWGTRPGA